MRLILFFYLPFDIIGYALKTLDKLAAFKEKLGNQKRLFADKQLENENIVDAMSEKYQSLSDDEKDVGWFGGQLRFSRHIDDALRNNVQPR